MRIIEQLVYKIIGDTKDLDRSIDGSDKKVDGFSGRLGSLGKMLTVGAVAVGLVSVAKKLYDMATETAAAADRIDKMSQKIGISAEAFQEWDFILSQSGASVDGLQTGMKTLSRAADEASQGTAEYAEAFYRLGVSVTDSSGKLKSQEVLFTEVFEALAEVEGETERTAIATQLLGRSATELAPALNAGKDGIEAMRAQAHELGLVLDDTTIKAGVDLTDAVDRLERKFESLKNRALTPVVAGLADVIDRLSGTKTPLDDMNEILGKLEQNGKDYARALVDVEKNTDGVKDATLELLAVQKQQLLFDLEKAYFDAGRELEKYNKQLENNREINIKNGKVLDDIAAEYGVTRDELRKLAAANSEMFIDQRTGINRYKEAVNAVNISFDKYREAQIELAKIEQDKQRFINASADAYINEGMSIERIKDLDLELYNEIARLIESRKIQISSEKDLQDQLHGTTLDQINVTTATKVATEATEEAEDATINLVNANGLLYRSLHSMPIKEETEAMQELNEGVGQSTLTWYELQDALREAGIWLYQNRVNTAETTDAIDEMVYSTNTARNALSMLDRSMQEFEATTESSKTALGEWADANVEGISKTRQALNGIGSLVGRIGDLQQAQTDARIAALDKEVMGEEAYAEKVKSIKREEAERQKRMGIFETIINTAAGITKAIPNPWLMALAGVSGAVQLATIQAQPIPSFDVGSIRIPETTTAVVHKDEMILTAPQAEQARREGISIGPSGGGLTQAAVYLDGIQVGKIIWNHGNGGRLGVIDKRVVK